MSSKIWVSPFHFFFTTGSIYEGDLDKKKLTNENKIHHTCILPNSSLFNQILWSVLKISKASNQIQY